MTLTEFLLARIAEDEESARFVEDAPGEVLRRRVDPLRVSATGEVSFAYLTVDPARALAECEAKRRIVRLHDSRYIGFDGAVEELGGHDCTVPDEDGAPRFAYTEECGTLLALALPYAGHPDYDPEWSL